MLTSLAPASANSRASSPGWSGHRDEDRARGGGGPAVLARDGPGAVHAPGEQGADLLPGARGHGPDQGLELPADLAEQPEHGVGVAGDDLFPQHGVAAGDPGHVADALARQREVVGGGVGQSAGHQHREQVRQVGDPRDGPVVLGRGEMDGDRVAETHQRLDHGDGVRQGGLVRRDGPGATVEQGRARRERAGALAAGHGVAADVPRQGVRGRIPAGIGRPAG